MPRNKIVGTNTRPKSNKATGRDYKKERKENASNGENRKRLNKLARSLGEYGEKHKKGVDRSHKSDGTTTLEKRSDNRARQGSGGKSKLKPAGKKKSMSKARKKVYKARKKVGKRTKK